MLFGYILIAAVITVIGILAVVTIDDRLTRIARALEGKNKKVK